MTPVHTYVQPDFCAVMPDDSMTGAGIYSGDLVCVVACDHVASGKIAAVCIGDALVVRRVNNAGSCLALTPENQAYSSTIVDGSAENVELLGRLVEARHILDEDAAADMPP